MIKEVWLIIVTLIMLLLRTLFHTPLHFTLFCRLTKA